MDVMDACHATAHAYPGGTESLAPRMGKAPAVLRQELLGKPGHKFGVRDMLRMIDLIEPADHRILHAINARYGYVALRVAGAEQCGDILGLLLDQHESATDFASSVRVAIADGVITKNELADIVARASESLAGINQVVAELHAEHNSALPPAGAV